MDKKFSITNKTKVKIPRLPFLKMKEMILGKGYELSVVFIDSKKSRQLNSLYRSKNKATDILSFSLSKNSGEIFMCLTEARKKAGEFGKDFTDFVGYLFIHGILHLKGMRHGSTMEKAEEKMSKKFRF